MRVLLRLMLPLLVLQGCAGNPVAQQLERSFDEPAAPASTPPAPATPAPATPATQTPKTATPKTETSTTETPQPPTSAAEPARDGGESADATIDPEQRDQPKGDTPDKDQPEGDKAGNGKEDSADPADDQAKDLPPSGLPQEPYRITIRLPGADPASPSDAVTRALRQAGVPFAVERIERIEP